MRTTQADAARVQEIARQRGIPIANAVDVWLAEKKGRAAEPRFGPETDPDRIPMPAELNAVQAKAVKKQSRSFEFEGCAAVWRNHEGKIIHVEP